MRCKPQSQVQVTDTMKEPHFGMCRGKVLPRRYHLILFLRRGQDPATTCSLMTVSFTGHSLPHPPTRDLLYLTLLAALVRIGVRHIVFASSTLIPISFSQYARYDESWCCWQRLQN